MALAKQLSIFPICYHIRISGIPWFSTAQRSHAEVIESQNHRLEKTSKIIKSVTPTPPCLLNHILKCHIYTFLNTSRDGDSTTSLGSLVQCLTTLDDIAPPHNKPHLA